jgi:glyoxylase-like metal-dependent hydrolase (beta-lactamase superfamily II)
MAEFHLLSGGYIRDDDRVGSTVSFVRDGNALIVIDPGMVWSREAAILEPLAVLGVAPDDVTDVVLSHHHPDHTMNAALFPVARVHDYWAWYHDDLWTGRDAEGFRVSKAVQLLETPGHTPQDISTVVETDAGVIVCTHMWWTAEGPAEDPYATDPAALHAHRERVLALDGLITIVPGHGEPFAPGASTPH